MRQSGLVQFHCNNRRHWLIVAPLPARLRAERPARCRLTGRRASRLQHAIVQAVAQQLPGGAQKRISSEPPWYHGKFRVMSSRLADWLSRPEDVRPARQVVQLLWKYPGNVSSLVAHEAAQCVAFRAAATTVMYGPVLEDEVSHKEPCFYWHTPTKGTIL
jgi:hypothetical protein